MKKKNKLSKSQKGAKLAKIVKGVGKVLGVILVVGSTISKLTGKGK